MFLTSPFIDQALALIDPSASPMKRGFECNRDVSPIEDGSVSTITE